MKSFYFLVSVGLFFICLHCFDSKGIGLENKVFTVGASKFPEPKDEKDIFAWDIDFENLWGKGVVEECPYTETEGKVTYVDPEKFRGLLREVSRRLNKFPLSIMFFKSFLRSVFSALGDNKDSIEEEIFLKWNCMDNKELEKYAIAFIQKYKDKELSHGVCHFDIMLHSYLKLTDIGCEIYFRGEKVEADCLKSIGVNMFLVLNQIIWGSFKTNEQGFLDKDGKFFLYGVKDCCKINIKSYSSGGKVVYAIPYKTGAEEKKTLFWYLTQKDEATGKYKFFKEDGDEWNDDYYLDIEVEAKDIAIHKVRGGHEVEIKDGNGKVIDMNNWYRGGNGGNGGDGCDACCPCCGRKGCCGCC